MFKKMQAGRSLCLIGLMVVSFSTMSLHGMITNEKASLTSALSIIQEELITLTVLRDSLSSRKTRYPDLYSREEAVLEEKINIQIEKFKTAIQECKAFLAGAEEIVAPR